MKISEHELSMLAIIRDEVNNWLKSSNRRDPKNSSIPKALTQILPKITGGKSFNVVINETSRDPFIMAIYPDIEELDKKSKELVHILDNPKVFGEEYVKTWCEISKWTLEIDVRILMKDCPLCVRSGDEFVAILCHEIGHVLGEDPYQLSYNYKKRKAQSDKFTKLVTSNSKFARKLLLPMFINTLSFRIVKKKNNSLHKEIAADAWVPDEYRGSLIKYVEDCILRNPDARWVIKDTESNETDQEVSIKFSEDAIGMMKDRMDVLKKQLTAQYNGCTGSEYHRKMTKFLGKSLSAYNPETEKSDVIMESSLHTAYCKEMVACEEAVEAALESVKVTDRDLTILEVECEEVKTTEDKIYLIHTIYDYIEAIQKENTAKLKKTKDPNIKDFIKNDSRLSRLNKCREVVMNKDTTDVGDQYGVFVRYPKGYEG